MDPQFQELASEIADAVEKRLSGTFEVRIASKIEERLSGVFEQRIKTHIDKSEERVAIQVEKRLSGAFEERIKTHINEFEKRAELRMQMHFENLETNVTLAAEGYGVTLKKIEGELVDLNKKVDTRLGDHDLVLANHNQRITTLEKAVPDDSKTSR